mmetsp:Transcript_31745/g.68569  ORF Transcript_31745/g.68569 Transcript_31745/m.68569 type:complete len:246 (-) Transcript_31745:542-1279(-)
MSSEFVLSTLSSQFTTNMEQQQQQQQLSSRIFDDDITIGHWNRCRFHPSGKRRRCHRRGHRLSSRHAQNEIASVRTTTSRGAKGASKSIIISSNNNNNNSSSENDGEQHGRSTPPAGSGMQHGRHLRPHRIGGRRFNIPRETHTGSGGRCRILRGSEGHDDRSGADQERGIQCQRIGIGGIEGFELVGGSHHRWIVVGIGGDGGNGRRDYRGRRWGGGGGGHFVRGIAFGGCVFGIRYFVSRGSR